MLTAFSLNTSTWKCWVKRPLISAQAPGRQRIETCSTKTLKMGPKAFGRKGPVPVQTMNLTAPKGKGIGWDPATSPIYLPRGPGTPKRQRRLECCQTHQVTSFLWTETQRGVLIKESTGYTKNAQTISTASRTTGASNQFEGNQKAGQYLKGSFFRIPHILALKKSKQNKQTQEESQLFLEQL